MPRRTIGLVLVIAGTASLAAAVVVLVAVLRNGTDWSGRALVKLAAGLGMALISLGVGLLRGLPLDVPEKRPTSLVVVLLALTLFLPMLAGAVLLFLGNFDGAASVGRWLGTTAFLAVSLALVLALLRDVLGRLGRGRGERARPPSSSGTAPAAALPRRAPPLPGELGEVLFVRRMSRVTGLAVGALSSVLLLLGVALLRSPPAPSDSNAATAIGFFVSAGVLGLVAWRSLSSGLWFHRRGLRQRAFFSSFAARYEELTQLSSEDLVFEHGGRHHSVVIRFRAQGRARRLVLSGRLGPTLDERRDPDADAILRLVVGGGAGDGAAAG